MQAQQGVSIVARHENRCRNGFDSRNWRGALGGRVACLSKRGRRRMRKEAEGCGQEVGASMHAVTAKEVGECLERVDD